MTAYFTNVFSPETHAAFSRGDRSLAGFRARQRPAVARLKRGDRLVAYVTGLSRSAGLFEIDDPTPLESNEPRFTDADDPFIVRVRIKLLVWLDLERSLPIRGALWDGLSFTREHARNSALWTATVRNSLKPLTGSDGALLDRALHDQARAQTVHALTEAEERALSKLAVRRQDGEVEVVVPHDEDDEPEQVTARESIQVQALLARIGGAMGFRIWAPSNDRAAVLREWSEGAALMLDRLPLNYDLTTLRTIENIDVLWIKGRSIVRAFEVEHTTAIYSGILRMADLLALQPNMDIKLHIVAPEDRQEKVLNEIRRPVFSLLEGAPLQRRCTFLSYDSLRELAAQPHLAHLSDSVLRDYEETA